MSARETMEYLVQGAALNRQDPLRNGHILHFPATGELVVAGDLHNHWRNYEKIKTFSALDCFPERHVFLQELIHGGALGPEGEDTSLQMLLDAIDWAFQYPGRVHFLLANHDLAQIQATPIMKDGYDLTERFNRAFQVYYGGRAAEVAAAYREFVHSMPLAGITISGIFLSHSLPGDSDLPSFDAGIVRRTLTDADYQRNGSVYKMVWGRSQSEQTLATLSKFWWADVFICGHQAQESGYGRLGKNMLILDSSHNHGVLLPLVLEKQYTMDDLVQALVPLAGVE
ncbi:MAG: metallophosphoesterase [Planctomycetes bacterium]|jgi:hypothetical protein|nr:metallophosphoesterase [Planctomycetota bacterium]